MHGSFQRNIHKDISINITILGSTIREIPQGVFSISRTPGTSQPDTMPLLALQIVNSEVGKIAQGALGNFTVQSLSFVNSIFDLLETAAVDNNFLGTISLVNNTFRQLRHQALILHNASHSTNLELKGNRFTGDYWNLLSGKSHKINYGIKHILNTFSSYQIIWIDCQSHFSLTIHPNKLISFTK